MAGYFSSTPVQRFPMSSTRAAAPSWNASLPTINEALPLCLPRSLQRFHASSA